MQSMNPEMMGDVEEIIRKNISRIIKISYATDIGDNTRPGYLILYPVNQPEKKLVSPNGPYIKICSMLDSERNPIEGIAPSEINIEDISRLEVLDYLTFPKNKHFPLSDIVEVCFEEKRTGSKFTSLFTLDDKKNTKGSLEEIKNREYCDSDFKDSDLLVVLKRFS